ncbi:hypothetical protein BKP45_14165 [Anaerobacillus alkalidiazotrophicus]|uniref:Uncharacterized protein n=1 Tax=Anaerobacillus alkalidiazotrophicus TaxID=472963 RepID=A0A1S2M6L4_9BACI|nr:hypothetical protein [Anaerobacillus alkalidiazotrophicus]OIJ19295.1 hypothetical protein BKP45_14165 [Anaerobacillus alkalidiazotrophicus]
MALSFLEYKNTLLKEYDWLKTTFPINGFVLRKLNIYNCKDYNKKYANDHQEKYKEKDIDAFVMEKISFDKIEMSIFMILDEEHELDTIDLMVLEKGKINPDHLFFWMLYHEYGHIYQLQRTFRLKGYDGFLDERDESEELINQLYDQYCRGEILKKDLDKAYRNLWFEKEADDFANHVYQQRKHTLPK